MQVNYKKGSANNRARLFQDFFILVFGLVVFGLLAWAFSGCGKIKPCEFFQNCAEPLPFPTAMQTPIPSSSPTAGPTAQPTASPTPSQSNKTYTITRGIIKILLKGLFKLPLSKTLDNLSMVNVVAESEGEPLDRRKPILEIAARGYNTEPCLIPGKCDSGDRLGLEVTYSANLLYEDAGNFGGCGHGTNYHRRLAVGNISDEYGGSVVVTIRFDENKMKVSTPIDSVEWENPVLGSLEFSRIVVGSPWKQGYKKGQRSWLWDGLSAARYGGDAEVVFWEGERGEVKGCP